MVTVVPAGDERALAAMRASGIDFDVTRHGPVGSLEEEPPAGAPAMTGVAGAGGAGPLMPAGSCVAMAWDLATTAVLRSCGC